MSSSPSGVPVWRGPSTSSALSDVSGPALPPALGAARLDRRGRCRAAAASSLAFLPKRLRPPLSDDFLIVTTSPAGRRVAAAGALRSATSSSGSGEWLGGTRLRASGSGSGSAAKSLSSAKRIERVGRRHRQIERRGRRGAGRRAEPHRPRAAPASRGGRRTSAAARRTSGGRDRAQLAALRGPQRAGAARRPGRRRPAAACRLRAQKPRARAALDGHREER